MIHHGLHLRDELTQSVNLRLLFNQRFVKLVDIVLKMRQQALDIVETFAFGRIGGDRIHDGTGGHVLKKSLRRLRVVAALMALTMLFERAIDAASPTFEVTLSPETHTGPFSGRVYVFSSRKRTEPRLGPDWFHPEPFVACDVTDWQPGKSLRITPGEDSTLTSPRDWQDIDWQGSRVQAVVRLNPHERLIGKGAGNGFSKAQTIHDVTNPLSFTIDQRVPSRAFPETKWTKPIAVRSVLLSDFHDRDTTMRAAVLLPGSYFDEPQRRYPTLFIVPGFGGTHFDFRRNSPIGEQNEQGVEYLRVILDPSCPLGHHAFADSANNGPVGRAFIEELLPAFDGKYRSIAEPTARFLNGHSSGGWSTLWLQVTYPDMFGGVWATAPDPVDFHDFQRIDLYADRVNMYVDEQNRRRPLAIKGGRVALWYDDFAWREHVLGHGGQLHSFEAVFSPRGDDGRPLPLWDRESGVVDGDVARHWQSYDIRLFLERHWATLGPKLAGKLHIDIGTADTFLLDGSTRLLKQSLERLGSDAVINFHEGRDHNTLLTRDLRDRIRREMTSRFLNSHDGARGASTP